MKKNRRTAIYLFTCVLAETVSILTIIAGAIAENNMAIAIGGVGAMVSFFVAAVIDKYL